MATQRETGSETAPAARAHLALTPLRRAIAALGVTQLVGWGTTYYLPAILADSMGAGTGLPRPVIFGGVTIMLLVSAVTAPAVGRRLARDGARGGMVLGSMLVALGLAILSTAHGPVLFVLGWLVIGLATPLAMTQAATTAMVQIASEDGARRAITLLALFSGLASTASWPILVTLDATIGWRASLLVYAAVHLCVLAPLHAFALPRRRNTAEAASAARAAIGVNARASTTPGIAGAFALAAITFGLAGFVSWGLPLHVVTILRIFGHDPSSAVAMGSVLGPAQVLARLIDLVGARRFGILQMGVGATLLMPCALLALMGGASSTAAVTFAMLFGLSAGTMSVVRSVAPLKLFGREAYAVMTGRLAVPQNIAFAAAPLVFAGLSDALGPYGLLSIAFVASLGALVCMAVLTRRAHAAGVK